MVKSPNKYICRERYGDDVAAFGKKSWEIDLEERVHRTG
jgi:hypothetical protein